MKHDPILTFHFFCQHLINFVEEHELLKHRFVKNKLKVSLRTLFDALNEQIDKFVKGDAVKPVAGYDLEMLEQTQNGVIAIGKYFEMVYGLAEIPETEQQNFLVEYEELLIKYKIVR